MLRYRLVRLQLPLTLGFATTIHKTQGLTLSNIATNLTSCFERAQSYVAISRVRTLEGVHLAEPVELRNFQQKSNDMEQVHTEMNRLYKLAADTKQKYQFLNEE